MRITGGIYRGRSIKCPPGIIRPAMDRMRESVFAILGNLAGTGFLDLFSGSGAIGIEACSRGASQVVFVERDRGKIATLKENTSFVEQDIRIVCSSAAKYLATTAQRFDYVFADPPFDQKQKESIIQLISKKGVLTPEGILLMHHPEEEMLPEAVEDLILSDRRKYGRSIVNFYSGR